MSTIVQIAVLIFLAGTTALLFLLIRGSDNNEDDEPFDPEWMDYEKWRENK